MDTKPHQLFAALGNETRLRCLMLLAAQGELCVCELTHAIGTAQPHISRHLAQLRELGLVLDRREGLWIYYRIRPDLPSWVSSILRETQNGFGEAHPFAEDAHRLAMMPNRPSAPRCA
ncbi:transcriptional regulator, ArsR family [Thiorhodococcus drewsii AZ1]|uniref:Transcriptional regulator, ArsR family n=1 Tax=Thiorhodococcus drewsii AZ1 TaxID=765913 RepID=G2E4S4_9GAMM|nr:metalloregulator ArsR/SmtB family transcription factor [Thiorhodococcus drewsii]EGV29550.1 transcriptional regulator, ArsR family [Thiorhodococcus drewsii AZ1]